MNGYTAIFRPYLTFGQKRQLQKIISSAMTVDAETSKPNTKISAAVIYEAQDAAMEMMLVSLTKPDGTTLQGQAAYVAVQGFIGEDEKIGQAFYTKLDHITGNSYLGQAEEDKKKENA